MNAPIDFRYSSNTKWQDEIPWEQAVILHFDFLQQNV